LGFLKKIRGVFSVEVMNKNKKLGVDKIPGFSYHYAILTLSIYMELTILSLGAGVQSSTMALMASRGELLRPDGTPYKIDYAIFADTQREPKHTRVKHPDGYWIEGGVYGWLDWLEKHVTFPVHRITKGDLAADSLKLKKSKKGNVYMENHIPAFLIDEKGKGIYGRQCTANYKIKPIYSHLRKLLGAKRITTKTKHRVEMLVGISTDEVSRMKPSRLFWINNVHPLIDSGYSREECKAWMVQNGYPIPPRSACTFCPFHSQKEWRELKNESPLDFLEAVEFEKELQFYFQFQNSFGVGATPFLTDKGINLDLIDFGDSSEVVIPVGGNLIYFNVNADLGNLS
jgi:hypothetical protein